MRANLHTEPPDLFKRFVPTPYCANLRLDHAEVLVQTNDSSILNFLREYETQSSGGRQFVWKVIRDNVRVPLLAPTVIYHEPVTFVSMGPSCLVAIDHETPELFAFLGTVIDDSDFRVRIFPLLRELSWCLLGKQTEKLAGLAGSSHMGAVSAKDA